MRNFGKFFIKGIDVMQQGDPETNRILDYESAHIAYTLAIEITEMSRSTTIISKINKSAA
jgi:hypothetical protein